MFKAIKTIYGIISENTKTRCSVYPSGCPNSSLPRLKKTHVKYSKLMQNKILLHILLLKVGYT